MNTLEAIESSIQDLKNSKQSLLRQDPRQRVGCVSDYEEMIAELWVAKKIIRERKEVDNDQMFTLLYTHRNIYKQVRALNKAISEKDSKAIKELVKIFDEVDPGLLENIFENEKLNYIRELER